MTGARQARGVQGPDLAAGVRHAVGCGTHALLAVAVLAVVSACGTAPDATPAGTSSPDAGPTGTTSPTPPSPTPTATPTPTPTDTSWGPSLADVAQAEQIVAAMDTAQRAGQVIIARVPGSTPEAGADLVRTYGLGGVILFADNLGSPDQVAAMTAGLQQAAAETGRTYPLVIGVDQEGGTVDRVTTGVTATPTYMTYGAARDPELAAAAATVSATELRALGFTMVFAPSADVTSGPGDPTIGTRSASSDPAVVSATVAASVRAYVAAGIVPVVKHFPGHGSVPADSHVELPVQDAGLGELQARDLVPFRDVVAAGAPAVMVGHLDVRALDPGVPSSLSGASMAVLREDLGFDGLAVTDALEMAAVVERYGAGQAAVKALAAGEDVLLMPPDVSAARDAVVAAVDGGTLPPERLAEAATRFVAVSLWQQRIGAPVPGLDTLASPAHRDVSQQASLAALTVVAGPCDGPLVEGLVQVSGGTEQDRAAFAEAAVAAGLTVGGSGPVVRLLGGTEPGSGDIVVALDRPYGLGASTASVAKIALYGRTPGAFAALTDVLLGRVEGSGQLPVPVDGVERTGCP